MQKKSYTLIEIAEFLSAPLHGEKKCLIEGLATIQNAGPKKISFIDNPRYRKYLAATKAAAVIISPALLEECTTNAIVTENPYLAYAKLAQLFSYKQNTKRGIHPSAIIGKHCDIAASASIAPHAVIGDYVTVGENAVIGAGCVVGEHVSIGKNTFIYSNVSIYHHVKIGERVIIHSQAVIGSDGFGIAKDQEGWNKIPQLGGVIIEDDVEIGAGTTIDRGAIEDTWIKQGVKLDNQIQIGHNVIIGKHTVIAGCTGIAGSTTIGEYCMIGGGTGIGGHLNIVDHVSLTGMAMVTRSLDKPGVYSSGTGLQTNEAWRKSAVRFRQLDTFAERLNKLEKRLNQGDNS